MATFCNNKQVLYSIFQYDFATTNPLQNSITNQANLWQTLEALKEVKVDVFIVDAHCCKLNVSYKLPNSRHLEYF